MQELIDKFNEFFGEDAKAQIKGGFLEITVSSKTIVIELPSVVGGQCQPLETGVSNEQKGDRIC